MTTISELKHFANFDFAKKIVLDGLPEASYDPNLLRVNIVLGWYVYLQCIEARIHKRELDFNAETFEEYTNLICKCDALTLTDIETQIVESVGEILDSIKSFRLSKFMSEFRHPNCILRYAIVAMYSKAYSKAELFRLTNQIESKLDCLDVYVDSSDTTFKDSLKKQCRFLKYACTHAV